MQKTKKCIKCGKRKVVSKFQKRSDNGKLRNTCNECLKDQAKARREAKK